MPGFVSQPLDLLILALVAFLILGPRRFAETMGQAGRWLRELRDAASGLAAEEPRDTPDEHADGFAEPR
ncbi:MAG TPA: twin-arginine translocase TatA/TatE family subunit [Polyangiaceae bacterium]|nr:twin-arginine translocase TatA/TatE family subunit [Polyangiaceae bacterium]